MIPEVANLMNLPSNFFSVPTCRGICFPSKNDAALGLPGGNRSHGWADGGGCLSCPHGRLLSRSVSHDYDDNCFGHSMMLNSGKCALQCDGGKFTQFIFSPLCSFSSEVHRSGKVKDYLLKVGVTGEVSVLAGIAASSVKCQQKEKKSNEWEVISLSSSVYTRKGFLVSDKETLICVDKGMRFNVEGIEIGLEEILIVTTEVERWVYEVLTKDICFLINRLVFMMWLNLLYGKDRQDLF